MALAGASFWMLLAGPEEILGMDLGKLSVGLSVLVAWLALYGVTAAPRGELDDEVSPGEWRAWIGLGFTALVAAYLLTKADVIAAASDHRDLGRIGRNIVLLLIAWAVVSQTLQWRWQGKVLEDERDRDIERKAAGWARAALVAVVLGLAFMFGFSPAERLAWATPITIAHLLLFGLVWHSLVEYAVTVAAYWRDRRA
ncbi:hypothetical protein GCM10027193_02130 [Arenimonas aestuarii]